MRKKKSKGSIREWTKLLDKEMSHLINSVGHCVRCRNITTLQCAHVIPRTNKTLRWNPMNLICLCFRCHLMWAHKDPLAFTDWFTSTYPERTIFLQENRNKIIKRSVQDYEAILKAIKDRNMKYLVEN